MELFLNMFSRYTAAASGLLWSPVTLYALLALGVLFTVWSGFSQYRSLTHGAAITLGKYDRQKGAGAISHFQALSAALSATVGVGNISGIAIGIALGGPGAVFWMWVVGFLGMALKTMEVTQAMTFRNTEDPDNPHGGPMWVAWRGLASIDPKYAKLGKILGGFFCVTLLIATATGGLAFQTWSAATVAQTSFQIPQIVCGLVLSVVVAMVILGGISRVGKATGRIVPFMCGLYMLAALFVIAVQIERVPEIFALIWEGAFGSLEARGAFLGGTAGWAFSQGLQRAFFSNEAGQGSSSIAHSAARTDEPVREGLVAGLEPFIDTLVVCTLTAMVILLSGSWNRNPDHAFETRPVFRTVEAGVWQLAPTPLPRNGGPWVQGDSFFVNVAGDPNPNTGASLRQLNGRAVFERGVGRIDWAAFPSRTKPAVADGGFYRAHLGAALTALSFERIQPGLGVWLITLATLLFAVSTMISWSYYGEQGVVFLFGAAAVKPYRILFCIGIVIASAGLIRSINDIANLSMLGTGAMLLVNVPIMLIFARRTIGDHRAYMAKLRKPR